MLRKYNEALVDCQNALWDYPNDKILQDKLKNLLQRLDPNFVELP